MSPAAGYPRALRIILVVALGLGVLVSVSATQGAAVAMSADTIDPQEPSLGPFRSVVPYAQEQERALKAQSRAMLAAIESMSTMRSVVLVLLAGAAMVLFVTALQIRWAGETPTTSAARRLWAAALAGAVLRTLDGAQDLVITQRATDAWGKALVQLEVPDAAVSVTLTRAMVSVASVGMTFVVVALFLAVALVIRSDRVQAAFVADEESD